MYNYMITQIDINLSQIYELFGNTITLDDIQTRNLIIFGLIINSKILIEIIDNSKIGHDLNTFESKSIKITKERIIDLIDRCEIIIEKKNIKKTLKLMTKIVISKPNEKLNILPNFDINFINRFIEIIINYNNILHLDEKNRNILLFIRKTFFHLANSMIETRLNDKELNNSNCFIQKRDLNHQKELLLNGFNFIDIILKKSVIKNVSSSIYKLTK